MCIISNLSEYFCVICKFEYFARYVILQIIYIYIKNSIGPNTDLCGTPLKTDFQFEILPSTITFCLLCVSHFSIQLITSLPIPWAFSLSNNL